MNRNVFPPSESASIAWSAIKRGWHDSFVKHDLAAMSVRIAAVPFSFLGQFIAARSLGVEGYGSWQALLALIDVIGYVAKLGLDATGVRFAAEYTATGRWSLLRGLQRVSLGASSFGAAAMGCLWWGTASAVDGVWSCRIVVFSSVLLLATVNVEVAAGLLRGQGFGVRSALFFHIVRHLGPLALFTWALLGKGDAPSTMSAVQAQLGTTLLALAAMVWLLPQSIPPQQRHEVRYAWHEWLRVSVPLWSVSACSVILQNAGLLIVQQSESPSDVGLFAVATRLAGFVGIGALLVSMTFAPRLSHALVEQRQRDFNRLVLAASMFSVIVGTIVAGTELLLAPELMRILGVRSGSGVGVLRTLILASWLQCFGQVSFLGLVMTGKPHIAAIAMVGVAVLHLSATWMTVHFFGIAGAAYSAVAIALLSQLLWIVLLYRRQRGFAA